MLNGACSIKMLFLKILQYSKENTRGGVSDKVADMNARIFIKKRLQHRCFTANFSKF